MATIQESKRLIEKVYLINLQMGEGKYITPLISGAHGIGKTDIVHSAAKSLGGESLTVEGGALKEGEIIGIPFLTKMDVNGKEEIIMDFIKHPAINAIKRLEEELYERAKSGLLGGRVKLNSKGELEYQFDGETHKIVERTRAEQIIDGDDNKFKFGDKLPFELKLELIKSGEITPIILFIDEMNRTDEQTMKEFMNVVLNKQVQSYKIPWWVQMVAAQNPSSQNSSYATNELDPAQLDRFLKLNTISTMGEFSDYMIEKYPAQIVDAIQSSNLLMSNDKSLIDTQEMTTSPRSWETASVIVMANDALLKAGAYSHMNIGMDAHDEDLRALLIGKIGMSATTAFLSGLREAETLVKPEEVINGKSLANKDGTIKRGDKGHIPEEIKERLLKQKSSRTRLTAITVIQHLADNWDRWEKDKKTLSIVQEQFQTYINDILNEDANARTYFLTKLLDKETRVKSGANLFLKVHKLVSSDLLKGIREADKTLKDLKDI